MCVPYIFMVTSPDKPHRHERLVVLVGIPDVSIYGRHVKYANAVSVFDLKNISTTLKLAS